MMKDGFTNIKNGHWSKAVAFCCGRYANIY